MAWLIPNLLRTSFVACKSNCGPLSDMIVLGNPTLENKFLCNCFRRCYIKELPQATLYTNQLLSKYRLPFSDGTLNRPKISNATFSNGRDGMSVICNVAFGNLPSGLVDIEHAFCILPLHHSSHLANENVFECGLVFCTPICPPNAEE